MILLKFFEELKNKMEKRISLQSSYVSTSQIMSHHLELDQIVETIYCKE